VTLTAAAARAAGLEALAGARPATYWLDSPDRPPPRPALRGDGVGDLVVVGGGYTGLWTALEAKQRDPAREVFLLEGKRIGWAASGRNGGFCEASLTHGLANGLTHFPDEIATLQALGRDNLDGIQAALLRHGIDCDWERNGQLTVAVAPWHVDELCEAYDLAAQHGVAAQLLDAEQTRTRVVSPTYLAGLAEPADSALVHPAKLAWGLAAACARLGVRIHEHTPVTGLEREGARITVRTAAGRVSGAAVALGTNAFRSPLRRARPFTVPVYDYVLVTEPLTPGQRASVGWHGREGVSDAGNRFHYYRLTADDRILWGGYDAIYHYGGRVSAAHEQRAASFADLAEHFFATFPQLEGLRFTHRWAGAVDTSTRFCPFFFSAYGGRVASVAGYTGLGVGASRFGARVMLDLLDGAPTQLTDLRMVRTKPVPFPPEPLGWLGVQLTRWSLARADHRGGARNLWLRTLDRFGVGFDS
jgi:glycine/D-amino acid oxidase-like deaminating enzyme